ncbi:hypothetical protein IWZ01DRAFT_527754 [Phyllosticta capitalensis]
MATYRYGCPQPPLYKQTGGWELRDTKFTVAGHDRVEGKRLREIFRPREYSPFRQPTLGYKKVFFIAQLKHYGIKHFPTDKIDDLFALLESSVHQGKCDSVPESVLEFQRQMQRSYEPTRQKWLIEFRAWDAAQKERCTTPGQRADHDFDWFLEYYFLTDGKPDPTKTPEILELQGHNDKSDRIVRTVPSLHTALCRYDVELENHCKLLIGWDRATVLRRADEKTKEIETKQRQKEEAESRKRDADWEKALRPHLSYLIRRKAMNLPAPESFDLRRCIGSYVLRCDEITKKEECGTFPLELTIWPGKEGSLLANFRFGVLDGTMLLDWSEDMLDYLAVELDEKPKISTRDPCLRHESPCDDCYECGFGSSEEEEEDEEEERTINAAGKRSAPESTTVANPPPKRQRTMAHLPRRVYFRLRGREASDEIMKYGSELFSEPQRGYLDFLDDECTQFVGISVYLPTVGDNIRFDGFKTSGALSKYPPDLWEEYSERQAEKSWDTLRLR